MKVLIVGAGGREHALAAKIRSDDPDVELYIAPGNPGTAALGRNIPIQATDISAVADLAEREGIDLTVVGPEAPLAAGLVDLFAGRGLAAFGPTAAAARLESSKAFSKRVMQECGVRTARFEVFTEVDAALAYIEAHPLPIVVKASGLAAGKGAIVCPSRAAATDAVRAMLLEGRFADAGREIVVEEYLQGRELSVFFVTDGERAVPLVASRDHKRRHEGDRGPNTGGMGAYAPVADGSPALVERVRREIALPVLEGMAERGCPYRGFLYAGLMLCEDGPAVIEFNCRMGDPEAQVVLPLMRASLLEPMAAIGRGERLGGWESGPPEGAALVTVIVSGGYPGPYRKGVPIELPPDLEGDNVRVYHAGTALDGCRLVTAGGRVLGITGLGSDLAEAAARSRAAAERVRFEGADWRRDIGRSEIEVAAGPA